MKNNKKILNLSLSAVFAALIFLATMIHVGFGANGGYVHLGDAVIYLCAAFLPAPYAASAAAIGAGLADIAGGAPLWAPATILIKALSCLFFTSKKETVLCTRNAIACIFGAILCVGGYYLAEVIIYGCGFIVPLASVPFNLIQTVASAVLFISIAVVFDKTGLKKKLMSIK